MAIMGNTPSMKSTKILEASRRLTLDKCDCLWSCDLDYVFGAGELSADALRLLPTQKSKSFIQRLLRGAGFNNSPISNLSHSILAGLVGAGA